MRYVWVVFVVLGIMASLAMSSEQPILTIKDFDEIEEIALPQYSGYESFGGKGALEDTLHYDAYPAYLLCISGAAPFNFEGAIRLTPTELAPYDGWYIRSVIFFHLNTQGSHSCKAKIYDEGTTSPPYTPGALLTQEPYTATIWGWERIDLLNPVKIDASKDVWISVEVTQVYNVDCILAVDVGPADTGKGDFIDGAGWSELWQIGIDLNWNIRAIVDSSLFSPPIHQGWNIIALPVIPDNPDPDSCFGDDIPSVNIYAYDEPSKSYNNPITLEMGKGYMLQSLWLDILDVAGTPVSLPYTITGLTRSFPNSYYGWNLAGNPVNDTIDFDSLTFDNVNFLYKYFNGYQYIFYPGGGASNLIPDWWGFWVQVNNPGMGSITVDAPAVVKGRSEPVCWDWRLKVSAKSGELIDEHNYIGVSSDDRVVDVVDFLVPLSEYVQAYFEGEEAGYQQLVLDGEQDAYEIPLDVEVNTGNPEVSISWEFEGYPEGMGVYLVDGGNEIDMRENDHYTFANSYEGGGSEIPTLEDPVLLLSRKAQGEIHYFTIKVEPLLGIEEAELLTTICGIHPNPLTKDAMVSFTLSKRAEVNLGVYDVSGRLVKNLIDGVMDSGEHSVMWDGGDLAGGVYFVKMHAGEVSVTKKAIVLR